VERAMFTIQSGYYLGESICINVFHAH